MFFPFLIRKKHDHIAVKHKYFTKRKDCENGGNLNLEVASIESYVVVFSNYVKKIIGVYLKILK